MNSLTISNLAPLRERVQYSIVSPAYSNGDAVDVRIAANGPGVWATLKDEIFGKGQTGLQSGGTGIGLYLVSPLVERYGGTVRVEDTDRTGLSSSSHYLGHID